MKFRPSLSLEPEFQQLTPQQAAAVVSLEMELGEKKARIGLYGKFVEVQLARRPERQTLGLYVCQLAVPGAGAIRSPVARVDVRPIRRGSPR